MVATVPVAFARNESIRPIAADDIAKLIELANLATGMSRDEALKRLSEDGTDAHHPIGKICAGAQVFQQIEIMNIENDGVDSRCAAEWV